RYVDTVTTNVDRITRYIPYIGPPMRVLEQSWDAVDRVLGSALALVEAPLSVWNADVLTQVQAVAHQQAPLAAADLVDQVLRANEPRAQLSQATRALQVRNANVWQHRFTQRLERGGGDLRRFTQLLGDSRDGFTRSRSGTLFDVGLFSIERRGGTDLIGEYTWRGIDTLSLHIDWLFDHDEVPIGWGAAEQRRQPTSRRGTHGGSYSRNPSASRRAQRALVPQNAYRGVPQIRDVINPASRAPRPLVYSVAAHLPAASVRTLDRLLMPAGLATVEGGHES